jgi:peroxidase
MQNDRLRVAMLVLALASFVMGATESAAQFPDEFRMIDGTANNLAHPHWGRAGIELLRMTTLDYADGVDAPAGPQRRSARDISNGVAAQPHAVFNPLDASGFVWQWGQFLDHDLDHTGVADPVEPFDIPVPPGDAFFDPEATGTQVIPFDRSHFRRVLGVRQQVNHITAYIDASRVYGSDPERARALRALDGTGRLQTRAGDLLPFNVEGWPNAPDPSAAFFLAGDVRANEHVGLTAMHTLFVREHNHWASQFRHHSALSGDEVYEYARAMVAAEMQAITYNEFLPMLLGPGALADYQGYDPQVNAGIANVFSTAAFRLGHSMLPPVLLRLQPNGQPIPAGHLPLQEAFFAPDEIMRHGIEPILRGLALQTAQNVDNWIVDAVRNFLFGPPGAGGMDLAAMNIQRGRDHGLPSYNRVREDIGLEPVTAFDVMSADPTVQQHLQAVYGTVDDIDIWVGGLAEDPVPGGLVGETFFTILKDQFERLRNGDRFWYQHDLSPAWVEVIEGRTLAAIIRDNTSIGAEMEHNVFIVPRALSHREFPNPGSH